MTRTPTGRISTRGLLIAIAVGAAAAGVTYLFITRPRWRAQVVEITHLALDLVGNAVKHVGIESGDQG